MEADDVQWERVGNFYYTIYTKPKVTFLTCGYRQNLKPCLINAAHPKLKPCFKHADSD